MESLCATSFVFILQFCIAKHRLYSFLSSVLASSSGSDQIQHFQYTTSECHIQILCGNLEEQVKQNFRNSDDQAD